MNLTSKKERCCGFEICLVLHAVLLLLLSNIGNRENSGSISPLLSLLWIRKE